MTPLGLLGPVNADWLKENKVVGCPHPHVPSGKDINKTYLENAFKTRTKRTFVYF